MYLDWLSLNEIQINHNDDLSLFTDKINSGIIEDINSRRKFYKSIVTI